MGFWATTCFIGSQESGTAECLGSLSSSPIHVPTASHPELFLSLSYVCKNIGKTFLKQMPECIYNFFKQMSDYINNLYLYKQTSA